MGLSQHLHTELLEWFFYLIRIGTVDTISLALGEENG
jgi:hypothetical protein